MGIIIVSIRVIENAAVAGVPVTTTSSVVETIDKDIVTTTTSDNVKIHSTSRTDVITVEIDLDFRIIGRVRTARRVDSSSTLRHILASNHLSRSNSNPRLQRILVTSNLQTFQASSSPRLHTEACLAILLPHHLVQLRLRLAVCLEWVTISRNKT